MAYAIELARKGVYSTPPNPAVGCVILQDNQLIAEGWHQKAGQPHAERLALAQAKEKGVSVEGSTVYVTLEPCSHHGKTPPCADAWWSLRLAVSSLPRKTRTLSSLEMEFFD